MTNILWAGLIIGSIGLLGGILLCVVSKLCQTNESNEKLEKIRAALPGANCGSCGFAGCDAYAEAVEQGNAEPGLCAPGGTQTAAALSEILGVAVDTTPKVAFAGCGGCNKKAVPRANYTGLASCAAAAALGGQKLCQNSCLGLGDCVTACEFNGLQVQNGLVNVLSENCVGCGRCVAVCPRGILSLHPADKKHARVVCGNTQKGPAAKKGCAVSCIGCGLCAKKCPAGAVTVQHFLARIDPEKCTACGNCVAACPQKVIVLQ